MTAWHVDHIGVICEACVDRFCGRPVTANPYSQEHAAEAHHAWQMAWAEADALLDMRGREEASRWLDAA